MLFPTKSSEKSGAVALSFLAPPKQDTSAIVPTDCSELMRLVNQAEDSMRIQFQQIKSSLCGLHDGTPSCMPNVKDIERMVLEKLLQSEREQVAQQRAEEQEQLRATMQQLVDAWLELEHQQMLLVGSRTESPVSRETEDLTHSDSPGLSSDGSAICASQVPTAEMLSMANFDSPRRLNPIATMDSSTNEELFHKLRSDLLRKNK